MPIKYHEENKNFYNDLRVENKLILFIKNIEADVYNCVIDNEVSKSDKCKRIKEYKDVITNLRNDIIEFDGNEYSFRETIMMYASSTYFKHDGDINKAVDYVLFNGSRDALSIYFHAFRLSKSEYDRSDFLDIMHRFFVMYFSKALDNERTADIFADCFSMVKEWHKSYFERIKAHVTDVSKRREYISEVEVNNDIGMLGVDDIDSHTLEYLQVMASVLNLKIKIAKENSHYDVNALQEQLDSVERRKYNIIAECKTFREYTKIIYGLDAIFLLWKYCDIAGVDSVYSNELEDIYYDIRNAICSSERVVREHNTARASEYEKLAAAENEIELIDEKKRREVSLSVIQSLIEAISEKNDDIDALITNIRKNIRACSREDHDLANIEEALTTFAKVFSKKLEANDPSFKRVFAGLKEEILKDYLPVSDELISTLASAEYLYSSYVAQKSEMKNFDYGCVSILYYQAFEQAYNELIIQPYISYMISRGVYVVDSKDGFGINEENYLSQRMTKSFIKRDGKWADSIMYGDFVYLMKCAGDNKPYVRHFVDFLKKKFGEKFDFDEIYDFALDVDSARESRNKAAHGGTLVTFADATKARENIYIHESGNEYVKLLVQLMRLCSGNK